MKRDATDRTRDGASRRGFLGGALAVTLAAAVLPSDRVVTPKKKWETGKTRWIGHW